MPLPFRFIPFLTILLMVLSSCTTPPSATTAQSGDNPFLQPFDTPHGVPPFDDIGMEHYLPAIEQGMSEQQEEVAAIIANPEEPTFENTVEALERSGETLRRATGVFYMLNSADTNDEMQDLAQQIAPMMSEHSDSIYLNADLFARVEAVHNSPAAAELDPEQYRLLDELYRGFIRSGVSLTGEANERLREINGELATLTQQFGQNMLAETNAYELVIEDEAELEGLSDGLIAAAARAAEERGHDGKWVFTLNNPSIFPFLSNSPNRAYRQDIFLAYANRGDNDNANDNKAILSRMAALRAERAQLLGYETHAHYILADNMAETPEQAYAFLDQLWPAGLARAVEEREEMQQMLRADGYEDELQPWDWWYYAEQIRRTRFNLDEEELRPYFSVDAVFEGVGNLAERLFGVTMHERTDLPIYHPDVKVYEVREADGSFIGIFYTDYFTRSSKRGGAWMNSTSRQQKFEGQVYPVVYNTANFPPPTDSQPSLLSYDEAATLLHEFGHAIHGLLSDVNYRSLSGTAVPRDFVEYPSQVLENWIGEPEFIRTFARHYETGEVIPDELIDRVLAAEQFNAGFRTTEYLAASYLDLAWHTLTEPVEHEARAFEAAEMERIGLIDEIIPRYRSTYFAHIFSGGYSAGYYSYIWSEVLDADTFAQFKQRGLFNRELADAYRREILERGNTRPAMEHFRAFLGRDPEVAPLLERRGLVTD